jgi:hypothetical protein
LFIAAAFGVDIEPDGMPLGPVLAAAVVCLLGGKEMRRSWWSSLKNIKTGISWYIAALLLPIVVILCSVGINHLFGAPMPGRDQLIPTINLSLYFIMFAFVGLAKKPGGLHS